MRFISLFMLLALSGCMGVIEGPDGPMGVVDQPEAEVSKTVITLMLAERSFFAESFMLDGCAAWGAKGVSCRFTQDPTVADAFVKFDRTPCAVNEVGAYVLAAARWSTRDIVFFTSCLENAAGKGGDILSRYEGFAVVVAAHELGHLFGIWEHVPAACDDPHMTSADGTPICGSAVMNPIIDPRLRGFITGNDARAFDLRHAKETLIEHQAQKKSIERHDCVISSTSK